VSQNSRRIIQKKKSEQWSSSSDNDSMDEGVKPSLKKPKQPVVDDMDEYP
jgi:hypothetical protein